MAITDRGALTKEGVQAQARLLLHPLNLEDLIRRGILEKKGAWYRILKRKDLPAYASAQVSEVAPDSHGSMVKFANLSKKAAAQLEKMIGTRPKS